MASGINAKLCANIKRCMGMETRHLEKVRINDWRFSATNIM
jgi:hypothetical protein